MAQDPLITLEQMKEHLNLSSVITDDDNYIQNIMDVAELSVFKYLQSSRVEIEEKNDGVVPSPILHAMKLIAANLYANRENVAFGGNPVEVPYTFRYLLSSYLNY